MAEYSLSVVDDSGEVHQIQSDGEIQSILKVPFAEDDCKEFMNSNENKYLIQTSDGQLLWVSYSVDSPAAVSDSESAVFVIHSEDQPFFLSSQEDGNVLTVSSFENFSICDDEIDEDDEINPDDILKVEDRVKVFDAILAPIEKKVRVKTRVNANKDDKNFGNYICDLCGSSFVRAVQYYGHLHLHSGEFTWDCQFCPEGCRFTSQSQLRRHEKRYHVNLRPHSCTQCGATFDRPSQLDYHKRRIHDGERPHSCQLCGKAFFKRSDLRTHLNTHLSVHGCMCEICGRRFSHVSNLTRHMRIHSGIKPYPCSVCGRRFNQLNSLNEHKASHMNQAPVSCCGKVFKTQALFRKHLKLTHQGNSVLSQETNGNKRRFHCKVCGTSFPFLTLLRKHEMSHSQFTCSSCKKESKTLEELKNHSCDKKGSPPAEEFIFDRDLEDGLEEYLDTNTDWIDPEPICESQLNKFGVGDSPICCDNLAEATKSLCYTAADVDKLVADTCRDVSANESPTVDGDCLEIDALLPSPSPPTPPINTVISVDDDSCIMTPQDPSNCMSQLRCDSFVSSVVFDQDIPIIVDDSLGGYSLVDDCAKVDVNVLAKNLNNEELTDGNCKKDNTYSHEDRSNNNTTTDEDNRVDCDKLDNNCESNYNTNISQSPDTISIENNENNCYNKVNVDCNTRNDTNNTNDDNNNISDNYCIDVNKNNKNDEGEINEICYKKDAKDKLVKKYCCSVCGKQFQKACNFRQHQGIHDIRRQLYKCKVCGRSFAWKSTLNKHSLSHSENPNPALFPCNFCSKLYTSASLLQAHVNRDHLKQRPHSCSICKKGFFKKYDLKIHSRTHTKERPYICGTCGRRFGHVSHLIRHERIHSGQRPYQCSSCPASFIQSTSLASHQKLHEKEPEYPVCYLEFVIEHPKEADKSS